MNDKLSSYLSKKGISGPWKIEPELTKIYHQIIVVPSYAERFTLPELLGSIGRQSKELLKNTVVIVVVNNGESAPMKDKENNKLTIEFLKNTKFPFDLRWVDATTDNYMLPEKTAGVGIARKIGLDLALSFAEPDTLLFSTDADCTLENDYLSYILNDYHTYNWLAAVVGFYHRRTSDPIINDAITKYENFLVMTAEKLEDAGSIFGYPSVGSTMISTAMTYASVGGMSRKKATEDFYFLQECAKFCGVKWIKKVLVHPSARSENRVYLGTGFRMSQAKNGLDLSTLQFNHSAFAILKIWLRLGTTSKSRDIQSVFTDCGKIHPDLVPFLKKEKIEGVWDGLQLSSPSDKHFKMQFHRWFDGFKTIRFLKYFSERTKH